MQKKKNTLVKTVLVKNLYVDDPLLAHDVASQFTLILWECIKLVLQYIK